MIRRIVPHKPIQHLFDKDAGTALKGCVELTIDSISGLVQIRSWSLVDEFPKILLLDDLGFHMVPKSLLVDLESCLTGL